MSTPTETAQRIVDEWYRWADRGGYIGFLDRPARDRLEAAIAYAISGAGNEKSAKAKAKGAA